MTVKLCLKKNTALLANVIVSCMSTRRNVNQDILYLQVISSITFWWTSSTSFSSFTDCFGGEHVQFHFCTRVEFCCGKSNIIMVSQYKKRLFHYAPLCGQRSPFEKAGHIILLTWYSHLHRDILPQLCIELILDGNEKTWKPVLSSHNHTNLAGHIQHR